MPERTPPVFGEAEIRSAFRLIMTESEAAETAAEWGGIDDSQESVGAIGGNPKGAYQPGSSTRLSEDMLILLSLVSPELDRKVESYLAFFRATPRAGSPEGKHWNQRRAELRELIAKRRSDP